MTRDKQVVSGQRDIAVALRYDGQSAPRVTAKGQQQLAERIIAAAELADVPLYPDPELALVLSRIPLGEEIPDNLYKAIAEVIAAGKQTQTATGMFCPDVESALRRRRQGMQMLSVGADAGILLAAATKIVSAFQTEV